MSIALVSAPAYAQDAAVEDTATDSEIVVTGTLIRNPNLESSSPVAVIGADEVSLRQASNAEQLLRETPGVTPNLGSGVNNGTIGASRVDLRGLGANRNIVLLDGARPVPFNFNGIVDLNLIPVALVERVDVLTGGASTTYGADAVSGVVNFITRRDFAGMDLQVQTGISEQGDTASFRADLVLGANFDDGRGNAVLAVGYQEADPLFFGSRGFGKFVLASNNGVAGGDSPTASPTSFGLAGSPGQNQQINPAGSALVPQYSLFNFNPFNVYVTPFERFNLFSKANYEVTDSVEVYARGMFSKTTTSSIIAASGVFGNNLNIPLSNPFLNDGIRSQLCALADFNTAVAGRQGPTGPCTAANTTDLANALVYRRSVEVGPRINEYTTNVFDIQVGARYKPADNLVLDIYGAYGESETDQVLRNYVSNSRVAQALQATNTTTCTNTANGCVPLNLFGPQGSITPAQAAFIGGVTSTISTVTTLAQVHGVLSGDFGFTTGASENPIGFAVGGEFREYGAKRIPDNLAQIPGELGGSGGATLPIDGGFSVYEAFGEIIAPLVEDKPFFQELSVEAGIRYSDYKVDAPNSPTFSSTTYKFGANWAPIEDIKFRANYQRAIRAPNIGELFAPVAVGLTNLLIDPCAGAAPVGNANLTAVCIAQGAPAASIGAIQNPAAGQANITIGGNPNLKPEKATTYTFGVVIQPADIVPGLTVTLDYYNIKVEDAITSAAPGDSIAFCFGSVTAASATSADCLAIQRNRANGRLSGTSTATNPIPGLPGNLSNAGLLKTDGIDLNVNFKTDITDDIGLNLSFNGNYVFHSQFRSRPGGRLRECVGYYSVNCGVSTGLASGTGLSVGSPTPQFTWTQRTTLVFDKIDVSLLWRHIDGLQYEPGLPPLFSGTITNAPGADYALAGQQINFNRIKAYDYFDLTARFSVTDNFQLTLSAFNIFDKQPPIVGSSAGSTSFNGGNTYPSLYDTIGRRYSATASLKF
ncbi:TonB-dependent receptor domain-containing protein [Sphingopyxis sp.]|uniref:TonB-dependent receptor domain-containing protein n=1 Tax=Sphingopyxis sp. TaxID=1908224 RepID=UPI003F70A263